MPCRDPICGAVLGPQSIIVSGISYTREQKGNVKGMRFQAVVLRTFFFFFLELFLFYLFIRGSWRSCILLLTFLDLAAQSNHLVGTKHHGKSPLLTSRDTHDHAI